MTTDPSTVETAPTPRLTDTERASALVSAGSCLAADQALARIGQLVATIKAERHADRVAQPFIDSGERDELIALLRRFVAAREQERLTWNETLRQMKAELAEAQAAAQAGQARHEQHASRHQRELADLELRHEHQRSIWNLDRRRLMITIDGLENADATKGRRKRVQLGAAVGVLLCVGMIGLALAGNGGSGAAVGTPRRVIESLWSLSPTDLSCLIDCKRAPELVQQQGRL
jgi:hypothetical protein